MFLRTTQLSQSHGEDVHGLVSVWCRERSWFSMMDNSLLNVPLSTTASKVSRQSQPS